jgi:fucose 4-O-acetylase-like acetyltransferase
MISRARSDKAERLQPLRKTAPFDAAFTFAEHGLPSQGIYAMRGILICLVVLGHIPADSQIFESFKRMIYNFHVYGFLMISMLHPVVPFSWEPIVRLAKRYLVPVFVMSGLAFILFSFVVEPGSLSHFSSAFQAYTLALLTGNAFHFNAATGLELFWFMYALFGLAILRMLAFRYCASTTAKTAFLVICAGASWILVISIPYDVPAFLGVSAYILPFAVISFQFVHQLSTQSNAPHIVPILALIVFLTLSFFWMPEHSYNLAHLRVPVPSQIINYLTHLSYVGLAFYLIMKLAEIPTVQWVFAKIGRRSLGIYLLHMFLLYPVAPLINKTSLPALVNVCIIFVVVIIPSFVFARAFERS